MRNFKPKPLRDQVIVITGASSGIGRKSAQLMGAKGASVVLAARNEPALESAAREVASLGGHALVVPTDVSDRAQVERLAARTVDTFGRIDTWINDASVSAYAYLRSQPIEDIEQILRVNFFGIVHGCQIAIPHLARQGGTLINIGSVLSERSIPLQGAYCASKHAVAGFTESLRMELDYEKLPINVTLIKPAVIDTPFYTQAKSSLGKRPKAVPPIYDVSVPAEAIVFACENYRRDIYAGGAAAGMAAMQQVAPAALDGIMKAGGAFFEGQLTDEPDDGRSNLYRPEPGTGSTEGNNAGRSHTVALPSPYTSVFELHPAAKQVLAFAVVGGLAAFLVGRRK